MTEDLYNMAKNSNMIAAKREKNDEFYTQLSDISAELTHVEYSEAFRGKHIYCNCDNPEISQFFTFFCLNFVHLGLKRLTCTYLAGTGGSKDPIAYQYDIFGDANGDGVIDKGDIIKTKLSGNGSFDSQECVDILKECDVVVTNPPFSLFREYLALLMKYNKKFAIIANTNSITYKEVFPLINNNQIWPGYSFNKTLEFAVPDGYRFNREENGVKYGNGPAILWWTNIDLNKNHQPLLLYKRYYDDPTLYPKYDNYNAIEVGKVVNIPTDYDGYMGVPITFLGSYCSEQFEIVGLWNDKRDTNPIFIKGAEVNLDPAHKRFLGPVLNNKAVYARIIIKRK